MNKFNYLTVLIILFITLQVPAAQDAIELDHEVSIMELSDPLHARSQLGGLCVDILGFIYVSNFADAVWRIDRQGGVKLLTDGLYGASGNTLDQKGHLYQANFHDHSIVKIDRFGNIQPFISTGLNGPVGMIFDKNENLFVCNFNDNNIVKIDRDQHISIFSSGDMYNGPNGIAIDNKDNLYVVNFNNNQIIKITPIGEAQVFSEIPGPDGHAHIVYFQDNFYVTKIKSNQIYQINIVGDFKLLGGTGRSEIIAGKATAASFSAPNGIGVDVASGELFVNNVKGNWTSREYSTMEISRIKLLSIANILSYHIDNNDIEGAKRAFWEYHRNPFHAHENIGPAIGTLGWRYMAKRNVPAAQTLFSLIKEAYPDRWRPYYYLGETYKIIGQPKKALVYYQESLKRNPENPLVTGKIKELERLIP